LIRLLVSAFEPPQIKVAQRRVGRLERLVTQHGGAVVQGHEIREANFALARPLSAVRGGVKATPFTRYTKLP